MIYPWIFASNTSSKAHEWRVGTAARGCLKFLEVKDETKSDLSRGTQISSSSSISKLLALKPQRAPLEQKIIFADTTKEQESTHAKLKLKQAQSETLTREAVYRVMLNVRDENNKDELLSQVVPKGLGRIMHSFLYTQKPQQVSCKVLSKCHPNISLSNNLYHSKSRHKYLKHSLQHLSRSHRVL